MLFFKPEGQLIDTPQNRAMLRCSATLQEAFLAGKVLEARAVICDSEHNLIVDLGFCRGIIPREECAIGIRDGSTRDIAIISRVNKPVCFTITDIGRDVHGNLAPVLSRRMVQEQCLAQYIGSLRCGDIIDCRVTHLEPFGCFVELCIRDRSTSWWTPSTVLSRGTSICACTSRPATSSRSSGSRTT